MSQGINEQLKTFFNQYGYLENNCRFFVFREDGLILYSSKTVETKTASSCGALMGGTWQAAMTLISFIGKNKKQADFRLSFDSSQEGVHILSSGQFHNHKVYLGAIFTGQVNPAMLKNKIKNLNFKLSDFIKSCSAEIKKSNNEENFLFSNITDSEIDAMFSVVEN